MVAITLKTLMKAIKSSVDGDNMEDEYAKRLASHALSFFGYNDRIIDNALDQEERGAFYILEDYGLLSTEVEETTLHDGRDWRTHYWKFREENIVSDLDDEHGDGGGDGRGDGTFVYDELPSDAWDRNW